MRILRRDFLKLGLAQAAVTALPAPVFAQNVQASPIRRTTPSILQGATDETKTQFSIVHNQELKFESFVTNASGQIWRPDNVETISHSDHPQVITKIYFSTLYNDTFYLLLKDTQTQEIIDQRQFQTLDLDKPQLRFALCSCMDEFHHEPGIWKDLIGKNPEVIFFIGDSVYVDYPSDSGKEEASARLWRRFCEARSTLEIYFSQKLIPIFATWDDHDFGKDDSDSTSYPHVQESKKNFLSFFAQDEKYCRFLIPGPGVSSALSTQDYLFLLMDDRSYRLPRGSNDRYAHWGKEQEEWMLRLVQSHRGSIWIMNGSQVFPQLPFKESFSGEHKVQFKAVMEELKRSGKKVIFASGDVHFSEISKIEKSILGYQTYEITSSSVHSKSFPGLPYLMHNPRRIAMTPERNYILIDSQVTGAVVEMDVYSCSSGGRVNFSMNLEV